MATGLNTTYARVITKLYENRAVYQDEFTSDDLIQATELRQGTVQSIVNLLVTTGLLQIARREGNKNFYRLIADHWAPDAEAAKYREAHREQQARWGSGSGHTRVPVRVVKTVTYSVKLPHVDAPVDLTKAELTRLRDDLDAALND